MHRRLSKNPVVLAGVWVLVGSVATQLIRFASNLIFTRYLAPEVFGLMAVVFTISGLISLLMDLGVGVNIIQSRQGDDPTFLRTAWTLQILRSLFIAGAVIVVAGSMHFFEAGRWFSDASTYANPVLPLILMGMSISVILEGFTNIQVYVAERHLQQKTKVLHEFLTVVVPIPIMLIALQWQPNVWTLVIGALTGSLSKCIGSFLFFPRTHAQLEWDRQAFAALFRFGKWVLLSSFLGFMATQGDKIILAGVMPATQFGWFTVAMLMVGAIENLVNRIMMGVGLPMLSRAHRLSAGQVRATYYRARQILDPGFMIGAAGLFVIGDDLVQWLYPSNYHDVGWMVQVLSFRVALMTYGLQDQLLLARGAPKLLSALLAIQVITVILGLGVGQFWWNIEILLWIVALSALPGILVCFVLLAKNRWLDLPTEGRAVLYWCLGFVGAQGLEAVIH